MAGSSIAYAFSNKEAPEKHTLQYYLLGADRAIYKDGWKAVSKHKTGQPFEQDKWELYNLTTDFAENHDVAGEYPDTLNEMKEFWGQEAKKNNATLAEVGRGSSTAPDAANAGNSFKYYVGVKRIASSAAPKINNRSYTITASINRSDKSQNGVLVAMGDQFAGYTLYLKNNRLVYEYNLFGTVYKMKSNIEVPLGAATFKFEFKKTGPLAGVGRLYINDIMCGEVAMPKTARGPLTFESLDIGKDTHTPVSKEYEKMDGFPFEGNLQYVEYELKNDQRDAAH
jgi:arylsulfatase